MLEIGRGGCARAAALAAERSAWAVAGRGAGLGFSGVVESLIGVSSVSRRGRSFIDAGRADHSATRFSWHQPLRAAIDQMRECEV